MEHPIGHECAAARALRRRWERERSIRLEAEAIAERGLRTMYEKQQQLELLEAIVVAANQATSVEDALQRALAAICQSTGWLLGHAYVIPEGEDPRNLRSTGLWHNAGTDRMQALHHDFESMEFDPQTGLPGRVLAAKSSVWVPLDEKCDLPRAKRARSADITAAFAFPAMVENEVVAVLEFFSDRVVAPDEKFTYLIAQIGVQLGRVVERKRAENRLVHDASHDLLTGLPNRALFLDRLTRAVARHKRHPQAAFAALFIDLDRFKVVNDSLGHQAGDNLLIQVAARLSNALRQTDLVARGISSTESCDTLARLAGDEFTVLLEDLNNLSEAVRVAERIQETLSSPFLIDGQEIYTSASIGIASSATGYTSAAAVLRDADLAMYRAKALGKARYEIYDQTIHKKAVSRLTLETDLRRALHNNDFVLHYQPIVRLSSAEVVGVEALVRWRKSDSELIYPGDFIDVAEDTGLILNLGIWVLREACRTMRQWHLEFPRQRPLTISVNISARQFAQPDLIQQVRQIIQETGIDPHTVRLEITESVTMGDAQRTVNVLSQLRDLGVRFSIDDFGTGYSSLSYLHRFSLDVLKIDRSFILRMDECNEGLQIVQTIISLARNLGIEVVAEGTETAAHVAQLKSLNCDFGQGYYFSRPVGAASIRGLLESHMLPPASGKDANGKLITVPAGRLFDTSARPVSSADFKLVTPQGFLMRSDN